MSCIIYITRVWSFYKLNGEICVEVGAELALSECVCTNTVGCARALFFVRTGLNLVEGLDGDRRTGAH